jgi:hypothetical protein
MFRSVAPDALADPPLRQPPCARQPRHHGADRNADDVGDLAVRAPVQLAQHDHLAKIARQLGNAVAHELALGAFDRRRLRVDRQHDDRAGGCAVVAFLVEGFGGGELLALHQLQTGIANDPQQPRAAVLAAQRAEEAERAQERLLHGIVRQFVVLRHPAGETVRGVQMRQHQPLEALALFA